MSHWWVLLVLVLTLYLLISWDTRRRDHVNAEHQRLEQETISGHFEHESKGTPSRFIYLGNNRFQRHKIGTSASLDQTWTYDPHQDRYINKPVEYAVLDKATGTLSIHEHGSDALLERLVRYKVDCPCFTSIKPTRANAAMWYDARRIKPEERDAFATMLATKKKCIVFHDWNLTENMALVSQGVFLLDKKRTCFFYVPHYIHSLYDIHESSVPEASLAEMEPLLFAGVLVE